MISDTLSETIHEMDRYLLTYPDVYVGDQKERLLKLMESMRAMRKELDQLLDVETTATPNYLRVSIDAFEEERKARGK